MLLNIIYVMINKNLFKFLFKVRFIFFMKLFIYIEFLTNESLDRK